jgi:fumarylpyruvate hydrolase
MNYVFQPPPIHALPVADSDRFFPVRRVYCVGRNYAAHAREMGFDPDREPPFFFCKPGDAQSVVAVPQGQTLAIPYPSLTANFHYEVELVVALGKGGKNIAVEEAAAHIFGYAVGLDMTRRDLQIKMREQGRPWEIGKAFDSSAPVGLLHPKAQVGEIGDAQISLQVNGEVRQKSHLSHLIWSINETIANLSTLFELQPGDLIFSGTPEGVGPVQPGDHMHGQIAGLTPIDVAVV